MQRDEVATSESRGLRAPVTHTARVHFLGGQAEIMLSNRLTKPCLLHAIYSTKLWQIHPLVFTLACHRARKQQPSPGHA
eukprot:6207768-Pleurochrysis_carterae.AAC.2